MAWLDFCFDVVTVMIPIITSDYFLYMSGVLVVVALVCVLVRIKNVFI